MGERWGRGALVAPVVGLSLAALVLRWPAISSDGLQFDDAWVAIGGMKASPGQLLSVSTMHPGFTASLMGWSALTPATTQWVTMPAYLIGAATPAIAFLLFRRLGVRWWVSLFAGVLVLVAPTHIVYSGRVKPYMVEMVAILLLAAVLGRVARRRWTFGVAALWVAGAVAFATINAFAFLAIAVAAGILVLHPEGDWPIRAGAAAVQAVLQVLLLGAMQRSFDAEGLEAGWGEVFDGYVQLDRDPLDLAHEVGTHLARIGQVVVENRWLALGLVLLGLAGLVWRAWRGPYRVMARFLLALPAVAFVGSLAERLPFGTIVATEVFPGTRASLWLLPSVLAGVAFALDDIDRAMGVRAPAGRWAVRLAAGVALVVVVGGGVTFDADYPITGMDTAEAVVADGATGQDLVLVLANGRWSYSAVPEVDIDIRAAPDAIVGFEPDSADAGTQWVLPAVGWPGSSAQRQLASGDFDRVVVINGYPGTFDDVVPVVEEELRAQGFEPVRSVETDLAATDVWERSRDRG